jgi:hypothetical protein
MPVLTFLLPFLCPMLFFKRAYICIIISTSIVRDYSYCTYIEYPSMSECLWYFEPSLGSAIASIFCDIWADVFLLRIPVAHDKQICFLLELPVQCFLWL